ncbi:MAG: hypothetical protein PHW76_05940 [Alphaproteobacteria bacterium]|nr:hypothetical protein [Alphaproteobacteria bacterium]
MNNSDTMSRRNFMKRCGATFAAVIEYSSISGCIEKAAAEDVPVPGTIPISYDYHPSVIEYTGAADDGTGVLLRAGINKSASNKVVLSGYFERQEANLANQREVTLWGVDDDVVLVRVHKDDVDGVKTQRGVDVQVFKAVGESLTSVCAVTGTLSSRDNGPDEAGDAVYSNLVATEYFADPEKTAQSWKAIKSQGNNLLYKQYPTIVATYGAKIALPEKASFEDVLNKVIAEYHGYITPEKSAAFLEKYRAQIQQFKAVPVPA